MVEDHKARQAKRLQAALRENLKRRKAQARARAAGQRGDRPTHDSAGIARDNQTR